MPEDPYLAFKRGLDNSMRVAENGAEYWMARDLMPLLGYASWDKFENIIEKGTAGCRSAGLEPANHFSRTGNMVSIGSGAMREKSDWYLTRYACYLIAMSGDASKPEVGYAMTYFAVQTRRQEVTDEQKRLEIRLRIMQNNKVLAGVAKEVGVTTYAFFQDAGYRGLYGMGLSRMKEYRGVGEKEEFLDRVGNLELSANDFRISLAKHRLKNEAVHGQETACRVHEKAGEHVREAMMRDHGQCPEDLPLEPSIKRLVDQQRRRLSKKATKKLPA